MKSTLYTPDTITVGFQTRTDTFTGKLAYVIYTDHKGVLRKQTSWNSWRDHKIEPVTFENTPNSGFTLNKGVQRDGYWGSGRSMIRVWDPRDFEFEISIDNLIGILMHSDVTKRDITQPCVFAWFNTELVLLPTNSVEYQESVKHTEKQKTKVSTKTLVVGQTYSIKASADRLAVYLGYLDRHQPVTKHGGDGSIYGSGSTTSSVMKKQHTFVELSGDKIYTVAYKSPSAYLGDLVSDTPPVELSTLLDAYYNTRESLPLEGLYVRPSETGYGNWVKLDDTCFAQIGSIPDYHDLRNHRNSPHTFDAPYVSQLCHFDPDTRTVEYTAQTMPPSRVYTYHGTYRNTAPQEIPEHLQDRAAQIVQQLKEAAIAVYDELNADGVPYTDQPYEVRAKRGSDFNRLLRDRIGAGTICCILHGGKKINAAP